MQEPKANTKAIKKTLRLYLSIITRGWRYTLSIAIAVALGSILIFYVPPLILAALLRHTGDLHFAAFCTYAFWFGLVRLLGSISWTVTLYPQHSL